MAFRRRRISVKPDGEGPRLTAVPPAEAAVAGSTLNILALVEAIGSH